MDNELGLLAEERGDYPSTLAAFRRALQTWQQVGDAHGAAEAQNNIGFAHCQLGDYGDAQVYWQQAADAYAALGEQTGRVRTMQNLGLLATAGGRWTEARQLQQQSLSLSERQRMLEEAALSRRNLAELELYLCGDALEDARQLSRLLRPPILDDMGLAAALQWLARSIDASGPMEVVTELEPLPPPGGELQTLLFRVAQEALNNASKHARAQSVLLRLVARSGELQLQVIDDGIGCDVEQALRAGGSGLPGMRERLRLYGGRLELRSAAGQGTRLRAVVPLSTGDAAA